MSRSTAFGDSSHLVRGLEVVLIIGMAVMALGVVGPLLDRPGLGLVGDTPITVDAPISDVDGVADVFPARSTDGATVDATTGRPPVLLDDEVLATLTLLEPDTGQRIIWIVWQVTPPLVALAGTWLVLGIVRSARRGDPFVAANERRLWSLASVVAVGGMVASLVGGMAETFLLQRSAAADRVDIAFTLSFLPIVIGVGIAVLASVWHVGIELRDDVDGMV